MATLKQYDHVCILFGHMEPNIAEFEVRCQKGFLVLINSFLSRLCTPRSTLMTRVT